MNFFFFRLPLRLPTYVKYCRTAFTVRAKNKRLFFRFIWSNITVLLFVNHIARKLVWLYGHTVYLLYFDLKIRKANFPSVLPSRFSYLKFGKPVELLKVIHNRFQIFQDTFTRAIYHGPNFVKKISLVFWSSWNFARTFLKEN